MVHNIRLFESTATDFSTNGLGCLHEATSCRVTEERNGIYELTLSYPTNGHLYEDLVNNAIIVAKPNPFANPQAFRIYSLSKPVRGIVTYNAAHISYDMSNYPVNTPVSTNASANIQTAFNALNSHIVVPTGQIFPFTFTKNETGSHGTIQVGKLDLKKPVSVKNALGGTDGSILDGFHVEYEFDNYTVIAYNQRGTNNGMSIRYGKNLLSLDYSEDISEAYTYAYPYYYSDEYGLVTIETSTRSSLISLVENPTYFKVLMLDVTESFSDTKPSVNDVYNAALTKINNNNYSNAKVSVNISFVQLGKSSEYEKFKELESVKLCDTVNCYNEEVGIDFTAKCVRTVYDAISDKYEEITLGDPKVNLFKAFTDQTNKARSIIVETISGVEDALSGGIAIAQSTANGAQTTATNAQNTAIAAQSTANTASSKADAAQSTANTASSKADAAQSSATSAQNGVNALNTLFSDASGRSHVTLKKNAAGSAIEEIIVSDNPDYMATTTHLWRWNSQGLAYTNGGYNSSEYILGMNMNGKIWANYIDVQDTDGNSIFVADGQNKFVHMGLFNINELGLTYNYTERTEPNIHKAINIDPYAITFEKIDDNNDTIDSIYISPESIYFNQERTIGSHSLELTNKHVNLTYNDDSGIYLEMPSASGPIFRIGSSDDGPAPNAFSISYERVTENKAYLTLNGQTISNIATTIENSNSSVPTSALLYSEYALKSHTHKENDISGANAVSGNVTTIDKARYYEFNSNRFAFLPAEYITIEKSTDGGVTWSAYTTSDNSKMALVTTSANYYTGGTSSSSASNYQVRFTFTAHDTIYCRIDKILAFIATNGTMNAHMIIETATVGNPTVYTTIDTYNVSGWSGWNSIPVSITFGGYEGQLNNIQNIRLTFYYEGKSASYSNNQLCIREIRALADAMWIVPNNMAETGHLYSYDVLQNATFPAKVLATELVENGMSLVSKYAEINHTHTEMPMCITLNGDEDVITGDEFNNYYTNPNPSHVIYHSGQRQYYYLQMKDANTYPDVYYICPSSSTSSASRDTIVITPTGYWSLRA